MAEFRKKRKTDDPRDLKEFWKKDKWQYLLKPLINDLYTGQLSYNAIVLKIDQADANLNKSFKNAYCSVLNHRFQNGFYVAESFGNLFKTGINVLLDYVNQGTLPKDEQQLDALSILTAFLESDQDYDWVAEKAEDTEKAWCIKMAQHFLSELSPSKNYVITNSYPCSDVFHGRKDHTAECCPCSRKERLYGEFGDTSFGVPSLWHGEADMLYEIPVMFADGGEDEPDSVSESPSSFGTESKSGTNFPLQDLYQMRAQVINFAYTKRNEDKKEFGEHAPNYLVPHIGFSKEKLCFHFYDCVNDVLLTTRCNLFRELDRKIDYFVVILTWLALNYKLLGGNTPDRLLEFKSGFHTMFTPELMKRYNEEAQRPCRTKPSFQTENLKYKLRLLWQDMKKE